MELDPDNIIEAMRERIGINSENIDEDVQGKSAEEILDGFEEGLEQQGENIQEIRLELEKRLDSKKRSNSGNLVSMTDDKEIKAERFNQEDGKIERLRKRIKILMSMEEKIEESLDEIEMLRVDLRIDDALGHNLNDELTDLTLETLGSSFKEDEQGHPLIDIHEGLKNISEARLEEQYGSHSEYEEVFLEEGEGPVEESEEETEEDIWME